MVKSQEQLRGILIGGFYTVMFIAQMIAWAIINHIRDYEKSIWFVTGAAALMTIVTCTLYLLFRKMICRFRAIDEITIVEDVYEIIRAGR